MTDIDTRLRAARGLGKDETKASLKAFESLRRRGHPQAPPPIASDGWGGITEAMIKVWGGSLPTGAGDVLRHASFPEMTGSISK